MPKYPLSFVKFSCSNALLTFIVLFFPTVNSASAYNADNEFKQVDKIVVKLSVNSDGTFDSVESVTPLTTEISVSVSDEPSDSEIQGIVEQSLALERKLAEECDLKIQRAIRDLRKISRHVSRSDIDSVKFATVKKCNIPCVEKVKYGFTRYQSLARHPHWSDRTLAGETACHDVDPSQTRPGEWTYARKFTHATVVGRGQYANKNWPLFGLYYNSYNPYGNPYFDFNPYPIVWRSGQSAWIIYTR